MEPLPRGANFVRAKTLWEIGLHIAGNAYQGIGIPDCIRMGKTAAGKILGALQ